MSQVKFSPGDLFFEPVSAFYASWIAYHSLHATQIHDVVSGRLRGRVIPQLRFENDPIIGILRRQDSIGAIRFEIDMSDPGDPIGRQIRSGRLMEFWCQQMFGHAYEIGYQHVKDLFGSNRKTAWPSTLQFSFHVRNGCFHGNRFNIRKNSISEVVPTEWRGSTIDYSNNGAKVAVEFLGPADFITLLYDVQTLLIEEE